jgi:hypothetical protein
MYDSEDLVVSDRSDLFKKRLERIENLSFLVCHFSIMKPQIKKMHTLISGLWVARPVHKHGSPKHCEKSV